MKKRCASVSPCGEPKHPIHTSGELQCQNVAGHAGKHTFEDEFVRHWWCDGDNPLCSAERKHLVLGGIFSPPREWWAI